MLKTFSWLLGLLIILPWIPLVVRGEEDLSKYFEFPPQTIYIEHASFEPGAFAALLVLLGVFFLFFIPRLLQFKENGSESATYKFPVWGWLSLLWTAVSWVIAWSRFEVFSLIQHHTFILLWLGFIFSANALCLKLKGSAPAISQSRRVIWLFPLSAFFWWVFEYINRFTQNWIYQEVSHYSDLEYFTLATLSFSTVLPAILSVKSCLETWRRAQVAFSDFIKISLFCRKGSLVLILILSCVFYSLIGIYPNEFYWMIWVAPPLMFVSLQGLRGRDSFFSDLARGDWRGLFLWGVSGLLCGVFWELWNLFSLSKWIYKVPYVGGAHIFEMPLPGYAGYIPFGIFCGLILEVLIEGRGKAPAAISADSSYTPKRGCISHVAIIMDGNGRWAKARGLARTAGHQKGAAVIRGIVESTLAQKLSYLTLFAFSTENWLRPKAEVDSLMSILKGFLKSEIEQLYSKNVRLRVNGDISLLPSDLMRLIREAERRTLECRGLTLVLAISYGGRREIANAMQRIGEKVKNGLIQPDQIGERCIREHLYYPEIPDPDLIIRTGGEFRLSNFLIWQAAYSEILVAEKFWPDFSALDFTECLKIYSLRTHRFGRVSLNLPA